MEQAITQVYSAESAKSQHPHFNIRIPVSFYDSTFDNGENGFFGGINHELRLVEFVYNLWWFSQQEFRVKTNAPLFVPTIMCGTRSWLGATTSALLCGDVDSCGDRGLAGEDDRGN